MDRRLVRHRDDPGTYPPAGGGQEGGGLPITGSDPQTYAGAGGALVLAGVLLLPAAQRRRCTIVVTQLLQLAVDPATKGWFRSDRLQHPAPPDVKRVSGGPRRCR